MSTRSYIAIATSKGFEWVYCHNDGYPSCNGRILLEHYQDHDKVAKLISMGHISTLDQKIGRKHNFDKRPKHTCNFYTRDRGETGCEASSGSFSELVEELEGIDYLYLWLDEAWLFSPAALVRTIDDLQVLTKEHCVDQARVPRPSR